MNNYSHDQPVRLPGTPDDTDRSWREPLANGIAASEPGASFAPRDRSNLRLITAVAKLYYEERCTQNKIADDFRLSQGTVCRLLQKAKEHGVVRTTVIPPEGSFVDLEELLEHKYGLTQVIIAHAATDSEETVQSALGAAAAHYMETTLKPREVIGVASWSDTLLSMVEQMPLIRKAADRQVVQIMGGLGEPSAERQAHHVVGQLAKLIQGEAHYLAAPGIVDSKAAADILAQDPHIRETMAKFDRITVALLGIGPVEPSPWLAASANRFSVEELQVLAAKGAVGNICLRFFNACGEEIQDQLGARVFGLELARLKSIPSVVGIAGGKRKRQAILGAVRGRWVNVLITDQFSAEALVRA